MVVKKYGMFEVDIIHIKHGSIEFQKSNERTAHWESYCPDTEWLKEQLELSRDIRQKKPDLYEKWLEKQLEESMLDADNQILFDEAWINEEINRHNEEKKTPEYIEKLRNIPFKDYESNGYFFERMLKTRGLLEASISNNDCNQTAINALELGKLMVESNMKIIWEDSALWGKKTLESNREAAQNTRKNTAEYRHKQVTELIDKGKTVRNAFNIVARNEGSSSSTIKKDYYFIKNRSNPLD